MSTRWQFLCAALAVAGLLPRAALQTSAAPPSNRLTAAEQREGWTLLVDGRSLDGWRGYNRPDAATTRWKVEDGMLTVPPSDGRDTHGHILLQDHGDQVWFCDIKIRRMP